MSVVLSEWHAVAAVAKWVLVAGTIVAEALALEQSIREVERVLDLVGMTRQ